MLGNLFCTVFYKEHAHLCHHITLVHSDLTLSLNFDQKITTKKWDKVRKLITFSFYDKTKIQRVLLRLHYSFFKHLSSFDDSSLPYSIKS